MGCFGVGWVGGFAGWWLVVGVLPNYVSACLASSPISMLHAMSSRMKRREELS